MFLKEKIKRILNRQPEMMKSSTPLYTFYKNKYGSELLIDIVALKDIKKYLAGKAVHTLTYYDITFITEGEGRFVIGHQTYNAVSRDVFFSRPGEIRSWEINCIKNGYALIFEDEFLSSFFKDTPQHIPAHINPGLVFLGNAVIQKQRQIQERADRGKARLISKTAVVGRQLHINIRLAAPCGGQVR